MNLLAPIKSTFLRLAGNFVPSSLKGSSWANAWLRGQEDTIGGGAQLLNALQQSVWVYSCVNAISDQVAHIPFRFSRGERRGERVVETGDVVALFERPHPHVDRFLFWELLVSWLLLRGKAFIVALDKDGGVLPVASQSGRGAKPAMLVILNPDRITKVVRGHALTGYRYFAGFHDPLPSHNFLPDEILCVRMANPDDFYEGLSPLAVAHLAAQTDYAAAQFMKGLMLNNADTGLIVTTDQQPTDDQRLAMAAAIKERKRKAGTADRPLFLWGGAKIEKPQITMVDMQFLENRKYSRQEICAIYRVPQEVLGYTEDANRAVAESTRLSFIENRIAPLCERLESAVDPIVKAFDLNLYGFFDIDSLPIMQSARRSRYQSAVQGFTMGVPLNVLNGVFDLGLPGDLPHGNNSYLPFSFQEVGTQKQQPKPQPTPEDEEQDNIGRMLRLLSPRTAHTCAANPEYEASIEGAISNKKSKLRTFFAEQEKRVLARLEQMKQFNWRAHLAAHKAWEQLFDLDSENLQLLGRMRPMLIADLEFGGAQLFAELGMEDFKLPPEKAIAFMKKRENKITDINETTFSKLKDSLSTGLQEGDTFEQLAARVRDVFQNASDERSGVIALTETNTAVNGGRFEGMNQAGVERKGWKTANLDGVRPSHAAAERDYIDGIALDQAFRVGGFDLMFPCDPNGPPEEVINCRCFTFAVVDAKGHKPGRMLSYEHWLTTKESRLQ